MTDDAGPAAMTDASGLPRLLLAVLGGTITMTGSGTGGIAPKLTAGDLLAAVPALGEVARIEPVSPLQLPGASLTLADLLGVAALVKRGFADGYDGAIVVQGTDTIEETAFVLDRLAKSHHPVVVTGAMRGPQMPGADGPANLLAAAVTAASERARGRGTMVVLDDTIHAARFVAKGHTGLPSAFISAPTGPLGHVIEGAAVFHVERTRPSAIELAEGADIPPVALLKVGLGDDGRLIDAVPSLGFEGLVVEAMGAGHVPALLAPKLAALAEAIPVVLTSRVPSGPVFRATYGFPGSETDLLRRGLLPTTDLPGLKARLLLQMLLASGANRVAIAAALEAS